MTLAVTAVCMVSVFFAVGVFCLPLPDSGPHIANGWGQTVRLRHLYAVKHGLHLLINENGKVHGSPEQSSYSLVEIRPVDTGCVAIKGVAASQYLCMEGNGRLYASKTYMKDDCSFKENILPDGYNIYVSDKHGTLVSLGGSRQRLQGRDRGIPALSQFLPRVSTLPLDITTDLELSAHPEQGPQSGLDIDTMDAFGKLSQISIQSPSFNKR
ncbi:fibroblast growth factor 19 [Salvelinus fontinalis]|uniref:fibroblast growth factor 19 n=1 Tax=Salvelinus fontinalis TaxID=8038 RepID=UPI0024852A7C|nr:fibroblast growth factor 19 [Salvelinus fontinalis]